MAIMTSQELREWYQRFSKELYEKAQIDVTRKEDLGRVQNFRITLKDVEEPLNTESEMTYAYIPHNGTDYDVPAPEKSDFARYAQWMADNLNPDLTVQQIRKLYELSCAGTLMVIRPGGSVSNMQMVLTDANGNITVSVPANTYYEFKDRVPEEQASFNVPAWVKEPDPANFGCPKKPVPPKNMNPGWLSRLGDRLGIETAYTRLVRYQEESEKYEQLMNTWRKDPKGKAAFDQAVLDRQEYLKKVEAYYAHPYCRFNAIENGQRGMVMKLDPNESTMLLDHLARERIYLQEQHNLTPQGKAELEVAAIEKHLSYAANTELAMQNLVGHAPEPEQQAKWAKRKGLDKKQVQAGTYDLPRDPNSEGLTGEEKQKNDAKLSDLAAVAGFAALADPNVAGYPPRKGLSLEETARENYSKLLSDLFTVGNSGSRDQLARLAGAREVAQGALYAYHANDPQLLGQLLANSLRQTMRETADMSNMFSDRTMGTLHLIGRLVNTLQEYPTVLEASGLKPEEMEEARGFVELNNVLTTGAKGRKALLDHAIGKKHLSPKEMEQAGKDALLANHVLREIGYSHSAEKTRDEAAVRNSAFPVNRNLLRQDWVHAAKNQLAEKVGLSRILSGDRERIMEIFRSNGELTKLTKDLELKTKPKQTEKSVELQSARMQTTRKSVAAK